MWEMNKGSSGIVAEVAHRWQLTMVSVLLATLAPQSAGRLIAPIVSVLWHVKTSRDFLRHETTSPPYNCSQSTHFSGTDSRVCLGLCGLRELFSFCSHRSIAVRISGRNVARL
jgi:hypothetical protein